MLYTSSLSTFKRTKKELKPYYVMPNYGHEAVVPDQSDLEQFMNGIMTWQGFKLNYLAKLMNPEAEEWMKRIANEAVSQDVVLVTDEEEAENRYRALLAEMILNMFSGQIKIRYAGELKP